MQKARQMGWHLVMHLVKQIHYCLDSQRLTGLLKAMQMVRLKVMLINCYLDLQKHLVRLMVKHLVTHLEMHLDCLMATH